MKLKNIVKLNFNIGNKKKDWDKIDEFCEPIEGIATEELIEELYKGHREDEKKFGSD